MLLSLIGRYENQAILFHVDNDKRYLSTVESLRNYPYDFVCAELCLARSERQEVADWYPIVVGPKFPSYILIGNIKIFFRHIRS